MRIDLPELLLRNLDDLAAFVKQDGPRAGGALIKRKDVFHSLLFPDNPIIFVVPACCGCPGQKKLMREQSAIRLEF
jgi:hypothetical protein